MLGPRRHAGAGCRDGQASAQLGPLREQPDAALQRRGRRQLVARRSTADRTWSAGRRRGSRRARPEPAVNRRWPARWPRDRRPGERSRRCAAAGRSAGRSAARTFGIAVELRDAGGPLYGRRTIVGDVEPADQAQLVRQARPPFGTQETFVARELETSAPDPRSDRRERARRTR